MKVFETNTAIFPLASLLKGELVGDLCFFQTILKISGFSFNQFKWLYPRKPKNPI